MRGKIVFNASVKETLHWENIPDGSVVQSDDVPEMVLLKVGDYGLRLRAVGSVAAGTLQCPGPSSTWDICEYKLDITLVH